MTVVQLDTSMGPVKIQLHDEAVPKTVQNFLKYVDEGFSILDPVLERNVQKVMGVDGHEIEIITFKRVSPYVARKLWPPFTFRGMP